MRRPGGTFGEDATAGGPFVVGMAFGAILMGILVLIARWLG
jgi:hypothetical protein